MPSPSESSTTPTRHRPLEPPQRPITSAAAPTARLRDWLTAPVGLAALGAALLWAALPPWDLWPLAWIAPLPWIVLIRRPALSVRRPYLKIWGVGFLFWMAALHWLRLPYWALCFGWVALSAWLAVYLPLFVALTRVATGRLRVPVIVAAPVVFTGLELARAHLLTGFLMASIAHTQSHWPAVVQISDLAGEYAVDFLMVFVAACLARMIPLRCLNTSHPSPPPPLRAPTEGWSGARGVMKQLLNETVEQGMPETTRRWALWPLAPAAALVVAALAYGHVRMTPREAPPAFRVALIQGSIDVDVKDDSSRNDEILQQYLGLTRDALQHRPQLIVWPETMYRWPLWIYDAGARVPPDWKYPQDEFAARMPSAAQGSIVALGELVDNFKTPSILGVDTRHFARDRTHFFNSAVQIDAHGRLLDRYDKQHPVMFGEYIPLAQYLPWLYDLTPLSAGLDCGSEAKSFAVGPLRFSPSICYETVLPHVIRGQVAQLAALGREPDVLVNLTNDGWFRGSSELDLHLRSGIFRAVECRKPLLVAANTGFSAWIDGDGRVLARGPRRQTGVVLADVHADGRHSLYLAIGDLPAGLCLAFAGVCAAVGLVRRRRG